jgi:hypothetical protein
MAMASERKCAHKENVLTSLLLKTDMPDIIVTMTWYVLARHDCNGDSAIVLQLVNEKAAY